MKWLLVGVLCGGVTSLSAQPPSVWSRTYDELQMTEQVGGVVCLPDTTYRFISSWSTSGSGRLRPTAVDQLGDTLWRTPTQNPNARYTPGIAKVVEHRMDSTLLWGGAVLAIGSNLPDGALHCFSDAGDSIWLRVYATPGFDGFNGMAMVADGSALLAGVYAVDGSSPSDAYAVRVDANGDTLWTRTYGGANTTENIYCARLTPDGGFILGGFQVQPGNDYEMLLLKLDSAGNMEWQEHYGSPWVDNVAFVEVLPQGGYLMAGAERAAANAPMRPVLYRLDDGGNELWSVPYPDSTLRVFFTVPVLMGDGGYTIAGTGQGDGQILGMLMRTDSLGNRLWKRSYSTNAVRDHYIYDLRRTLDGGFIMAGTAWDSLLVSQDAWLIKTDSFGCLVPGCQIFDGLQEQLTDLSASLAIYPNPAQDHVNVRLELPATLRVQGPLRMAVTSLDGRLVHERLVPLTFGPVPTASDRRSLAKAANCQLPTASWPSGTYFVHLLEGTRWLAGGKVVVSR